MANELRIADTTGLTYTCEVRQPDGTLIGSPVSLAESGASGRYYGNMPAAAAGVYDLIYIQNGIIEVTDAMYWSGTAVLSLNDALTATGFSTHTAADVVSSLTASQVQIALASNLTDAGNIIIRKTETLELAFANLDIPAATTKILWTVQSNLRNDDNDAVVQADSIDGLLRLNGAVAGTAGDCAITFDQNAGTANIELADNAIALMTGPTVMYYDLKAITSGSTSKILAHGLVKVEFYAGKMV